MNRPLIAFFIIFIFATLCGGYALLRTSAPITSRIEFGGTMLNIEMVTTATDQEKGLSGRDSMAADHGMLFVFSSEGNWGFWMKEMRFTLDIIWFDSQKRVVYVEQNLPPCTTDNCPVYTPSAKALYTLEVNAGFVQAHRIAMGDTFNFLS